MKKKFISALILIIFALSILLSVPATAFAGTKYITVQIGASTKSFEFSDEDISYALNQALSYCSTNASSKNRATVKAPSGTYYPTKVISLSSYTTLDLTDTVLVKNNNGDKNIFISPANNKAGYTSLACFKLVGGTLKYSDDYTLSHCLLRIAHANNIIIDGTSFLNSVDAHDVEIAACKYLTVKNCTFSGQKMNTTKTSLEALQIDILEESQHFVNMYPYDDTMNYGITVTGCVFSNLYRAVGTHSVFEGLYQSNISISNNTFTNIASTAISCSGYINTSIKNNVIKNCGEGIHFYMMKNDSSLSSVCKPNVKAPQINQNCNTVISGNTVSVKSNSVTKTASPIYIFGNEVTSAKSKSLKSGNYCVSNITVSNNTITTNGYGIRAYDVLNSKFSGNTLSFNGSASGMYGFLFGAKSKSNTISSNKISGFEGGVNLKESSKSNIISANQINSSNGNAIILQDGATASKITDNTVSTAKKVGILLKEGTSSGQISGNTISRCSNAISLYANAGTVKNNSLKYSQSFGIYIAVPGSAKVYNNTYSKNTKGRAYCKGTKKSYSFGNISTPSFTLSKANLSKTDKKHKKVVLKWTAPKTSSTYYIYRSTSKSGEYKKIGSVSSNKGTYTDKKVSKGKTYYYKVRAIKSMNSTKAYSSYSSVKKIKI